jgi:hypothetical protein
LRLSLSPAGDGGRGDHCEQQFVHVSLLGVLGLAIRRESQYGQDSTMFP